MIIKPRLWLSGYQQFISYTELHKSIREYVLKLCGQIFYRRKTGNEPVIFVPESLYVYP